MLQLNQSPKNQKNRFAVGLVLSALFHITFFSVFLIVIAVTKTKTPQIETIVVDFNPQVDMVAETPTNEKVKKKIEVSNRQIVDQDQNAANNIVPEDTRFLSAKNQVVEKQTVAKDHGEFQNKKDNDEKQGNPNAMDSETPSKGTSAKNDLSQFLPTTDSYAMMKKQMEKDTAASKGQWAAKSNSTGESSKTSDYLKDIQQGLETQLNTKEYKYYGYYSRIRKQLSQYWEPKVREKLSVMFRQGRTIATATDRITKLLIILNPSGTLVNVQMLSESGVQDLDEAAIEAFRSAAPFPNPPKGIVDPDGTVKIRWDFILET